MRTIASYLDWIPKDLSFHINGNYTDKRFTNVTNKELNARGISAFLPCRLCFECRVMDARFPKSLFDGADNLFGPGVRLQ